MPGGVCPSWVRFPLLTPRGALPRKPRSSDLMDEQSASTVGNPHPGRLPATRSSRAGTPKTRTHGSGFGIRIPIGFTGGVPACFNNYLVVVVVDEVVVVVEVVESEAEKRAVGDGGGSSASGASV